MTFAARLKPLCRQCTPMRRLGADGCPHGGLTFPADDTPVAPSQAGVTLTEAEREWTREDHDARTDRLRPIADALREGHDVLPEDRRYQDTWLHIALLAEEYFADAVAAAETKARAEGAAAERERMADDFLTDWGQEVGRDAAADIEAWIRSQS